MPKLSAATPLVLALALAACAASPDKIAPVSMGSAYAGVSCSRASAERAAAAEALAALEDRQRDAARNDAIGVILIGVPVASLSGNDAAGEIGLEKGRVAALDARLAGC